MLANCQMTIALPLESKFSFLSLDSVEKTSFIMASELWEENLSALLSLVKNNYNYS